MCALRLLAAAVAVVLACAAPAAAATLTPVTGSAPDAAALLPTVDGFRAALGGADNGTGPTTRASGRREIDWDAVPEALASPAALPGAYFNFTVPRGVVLTTPGTGVAVSQSASPRFSDVDPSYAATFATFSAPRLFAPQGATATDVAFRLPGTETPATVAGFGAVLSDVDAAGATTLAFFGRDGSPLGTVAAPPGPLSFAGATVAGDRIARVRITTGTAPLAPGTVDDADHDVVAVDDLLYGEPNEPAASFSLGEAAYEVHEDDGALRLTVRRRGPGGGGTVRVTTADGTADGGRDYGAVDQVLSFAPGDAAKAVAVPLVDDAARERDQTFTIALSEPKGGGLAAPASALVTIHNDPAPPDRTRPRLSVRRVGATMSRARFLRGLRPSVSTNEAASLDVKLLATATRAVISRTRDLALAHRRFSAARGTRTVRIRPARRLVGASRRFTVRLRITARDAAGNRRTRTRTIRVR